MKMEEKARVFMLGASLLKLKDKNGEESQLTEIRYCSDMEDSENYIGMSIVQKCYRPGNLIKELKPYMKKYCNVEIHRTLTESGSKNKIVKIENLDI